MAERTKEFNLRSREQTWATLKVTSDNKKMLCHQLDETQLKVCPPLLVYEDADLLRCNMVVREQGPCVELINSQGQLRLRLYEGDNGDFPEVIDPSGDARLWVSLDGPGSLGNEPIQTGSLALRLCRVKRDAKVMMGKPVIRGTRITVALLLRKLAGGATEAELLRDYHPHLTGADIREALEYAAEAMGKTE